MREIEIPKLCVGDSRIYGDSENKIHQIKEGHGHEANEVKRGESVFIIRRHHNVRVVCSRNADPQGPAGGNHGKGENQMFNYGLNEKHVLGDCYFHNPTYHMASIKFSNPLAPCSVPLNMITPNQA